MAADATVTIGYSYSYPIGGSVSSPNPIQNYLPQRGNPMEITWDPVERWLRHKKGGTEKLYRFHFGNFLKAAEKKHGFSTPMGFLQWANNQPQGITVAETLESYVSKLRPAYRGVAASAIKVFLEKNGYNALPKMGLETYTSDYIAGYTREQIILLLSYLDDPMQKQFVLTQKDEGFRASTTLALKWHHIKDDWDAGQKFVHPYLEKEFYVGRKAAGLSFLGPDSLYLLKDLVKQGKVEENDRTCPPNKPDKCKCSLIFPWSYRNLADLINRGKEKAKLPESIQPTHGLRKFFENALDKCEPRLDLDKKRQLEGHSLGTRRNYTDQIESLRPLYERAYPHLSLSEEVVADRKMKTLIEELKAARSEIQHFKDMEERLEQNELAVKMLYERERR